MEVIENTSHFLWGCVFFVIAKISSQSTHDRGKRTVPTTNLQIVPHEIPPQDIVLGIATTIHHSIKSTFLWEILFKWG